MANSARILSKVVALVILSSLFLPILAASDQWIKLQTPHFELYTTAGEKKGREAVLYFEQVRSFFMEASPSKRAPEFPVRIVAFKSENQYKPYRLSEAAFAYYMSGRTRDYIVMQDIASEHYPAAIHEYTHLIIQHAHLKLPIWLNEGWADFYSSLAPKGNKVVLGQLIPGRVQTLLTQKWIPLNVLFTVDHNSPLYNERNRAGVFYSQSWLLMHMLYLSPDYRSNFTKFVLAIANGQDSAAAFDSIYGKSIKDVTNDLNGYIRSDRFYGALVDVKLEKAAEAPQVSEVSPLESGLLLADVSTLLRKFDDARRTYQELAADNPNNPEIQKSLGYLDWQQGNMQSALAHFARAFQAGTQDPRMCFDYAMLQLSENSSNKDALVPLRRAVELKPDYIEARLQLGYALADQQSFAQAVIELRQVKNISAEQAPGYFLALAYSEYRIHQTEQARKDAEAAKKWAKTPSDSDRADKMIRAFYATNQPKFQPAEPQAQLSDARPTPEHPPAPATTFARSRQQLSRAEGIAQRLDCDGKSARLHVLVGDQKMVFEIVDPAKVRIQHSGEGEHDFACGPQKPFPVVIFYAAQPDAQKGTAGAVQELDF